MKASLRDVWEKAYAEARDWEAQTRLFMHGKSRAFAVSVSFDFNALFFSKDLFRWILTLHAA